MRKEIIAILKSTLLFFVLILLNTSTAFASEGYIEMLSTLGEDTRCRVDSHLMQDNNYKILISCRELIYPATSEVTTYVVWATPTGGGKTFKLGSLDYGRKEYSTKTSFSNIFVTSEKKVGSTPTGPVILRGNVEAYTFLQRPVTPTPTEKVSQAQDQQIGDNTSTSSAVQDTTNQNLSTKEKLLAAFKKAGLAAVLALVALVGLIFVVTKSRG